MSLKDPVERNAYMKKWRVANPDKVRKYRKKVDPAKAAASSAAYRKKNPEKCAAYLKKWRAANLEKYAATRARWEKDNPEKQILRRARVNARLKGLDFDLTEADISIPEVCPYLGLELVWAPDTPRTDDGPSLDRIDNTKGYVPGNVEVISWRANKLKSNATADEMMMMAVAMEAR